MNPFLGDLAAVQSISVTWFECKTPLQRWVVRWFHRVVGREVRARIPGYVGTSLFRPRNSAHLVSISMWEDQACMVRMGSVASHIRAARVPGRLRVKTTGGIYQYNGDWRTVLHGDYGESRFKSASLVRPGFFDGPSKIDISEGSE